MSNYEPRVYVKGDVTRVAHSPSDAVAFEFAGFKVKEEKAAQESAPKQSPAPVTQTVAVPDKPKKQEN